MFQDITIDDLHWNPFPKTRGNWFLVTAGGASGCDTLLGTLGGLISIWGVNAAEIFIRRSRYTKEFLDQSSHFSLAVLPPACKDALHYCGTHSGRDGDKWTAAGLTKTFIDGVPAPAEASLLLICRKLAAFDTDKAWLEPSVARDYYTGRWEGNPHTVYIGGIERILKKA